MYTKVRIAQIFTAKVD